jgi:hypothetical protein
MVEYLPLNRGEEMQQSVVVGEDGFLFNLDSDIRNHIAGRHNLFGPTLESWLSQLESRRAWCASKDIEYLFVPIPDRRVVYADKLPSVEREIAPDRAIRRILSGLDTRTREHCLYLEEVLKAGRKIEDTYYHTDVHLTNFGSYLAYREIMRPISSRVGSLVLSEVDLVRTKGSRIGDLGIRLEHEPREQVTLLSHPRMEENRRIYNNRMFDFGQLEIYQNANCHLPRAIVFRDSNGTDIIPFLNVHFSRLVAVSSLKFWYDLVRAERPDVVVTIMAERFIITERTYDFGPEDFSSFSKITLPLPVGSSPPAG